MNAEQYRAVIGWFNARPAAKKALRLVSRGAVGLVYLLYLGMLAWLALHRSEQLLPAAIVPAAAFLVGTLVRRVINRPRPYTALGFATLFPKDKPGHRRGRVVCAPPARHRAGRAGGADRGLPGRDRRPLYQRCTGRAGVRRSFCRAGLERLCAGGIRYGLLQHHATIKGMNL